MLLQKTVCYVRTIIPEKCYNSRNNSLFFYIILLFNSILYIRNIYYLHIIICELYIIYTCVMMRKVAVV